MLFEDGRFGEFDHFFGQIIGVHHPAFARFHLAVRQGDHPVGQVVTLLGPFVSEAAQDVEQALEVILLLRPDDIDGPNERVFLHFHHRSTEVLGNIEARAVGT